MKNNKKNKNDLRHLSRKELIDLICDMRRPNPSKDHGAPGRGLG